MILSYNGKAKIKFQLWFNNYKSKQPIFSKKKTMYYKSVFIHTMSKITTCNGIDDWEVFLFEKCETQAT